MRGLSSSEARYERSNMTLKESISSVEWDFLKWYERKVDFFSVECRKSLNPQIKSGYKHYLLLHAEYI